MYEKQIQKHFTTDMGLLSYSFLICHYNYGSTFNKGFNSRKYYITLVLTTVNIWLVPRAGKMNQIARCDWLSEGARWSHLARSGLPSVSRKQNFPKSHIINPLLTKFVRSRWLDIGLILGQYPAILTSHLVNNPYILFFVVLLAIIIISQLAHVL